MSFGNKPQFELLQLLNAGAGFTFNASQKPQFELLQLVNAAKASGARLTLTGLAHKPQFELLQLANAGKGIVVLED
ncbi:hypothetical protein ACK33C_13290 [Aeromonas hydrophila]|uniref:hypothetical protein n=1 Tax=Aeromonas TaxID=642 RepID=UPI00214DAFDD|nr:hypothetical protein [Aeromonas hydrophila]MCR3911078.1 hypothetical protein [Aeromonas hydrophila]